MGSRPDLLATDNKGRYASGKTREEYATQRPGFMVYFAELEQAQGICDAHNEQATSAGYSEAVHEEFGRFVAALIVAARAGCITEQARMIAQGGPALYCLQWCEQMIDAGMDDYIKRCEQRAGAVNSRWEQVRGTE